MPEVAQALRASSARVLVRWREALTRTLPKADELTLQSIENSIPQVLSELADALEGDEPAPVARLLADAPQHGEARFHQRFNIKELLIEYHLLRRVILEELFEQLGRPLNAEEAVAVNLAVDVALRQAVVRFAQHKDAELTNEAETMAKYLSFLSHDLRGGLNGAILMIEVLRRELIGEARFAESLSDLDAMRRSMLETVATMDRFLHAERLRRGKMPVKSGDVELSGLFAQLVRGAAHQIHDKRVSIETSLAGAPQVIRTDGEIVSIILSNLVSNAIKYASGAPVGVAACLRDRDGGVRITVSDSGPGIAPDKLAKLFEPFQRGETYGQKGSGLGLTIARQAAELLGARLTVESSVGQGCKFHLDLPS
jgi:signal transduction histidine kinase